jgi:hypothetical protein
VSQLCVNSLLVTRVTLITDAIEFGSLRVYLTQYELILKEVTMEHWTAPATNLSLKVMMNSRYGGKREREQHFETVNVYVVICSRWNGWKRTYGM